MRSKLDDGIADLRLLNLTSGITRWKAIFALVTGRLAGSPYYQVTSAAELDIDLLDGPQRIARDDRPIVARYAIIAIAAAHIVCFQMIVNQQLQTFTLDGRQH